MFQTNLVLSVENEIWEKSYYCIGKTKEGQSDLYS